MLTANVKRGHSKKHHLRNGILSSIGYCNCAYSGLYLPVIKLTDIWSLNPVNNVKVMLTNWFSKAANFTHVCIIGQSKKLC